MGCVYYMAWHEAIPSLVPSNKNADRDIRYITTHCEPSAAESQPTTNVCIYIYKCVYSEASWWWDYDDGHGGSIEVANVEQCFKPHLWWLCVGRVISTYALVSNTIQWKYRWEGRMLLDLEWQGSSGKTTSPHIVLRLKWPSLPIRVYICFASYTSKCVLHTVYSRASSRVSVSDVPAFKGEIW